MPTSIFERRQLAAEADEAKSAARHATKPGRSGLVRRGRRSRERRRPQRDAKQQVREAARAKKRRRKDRAPAAAPASRSKRVAFA